MSRKPPICPALYVHGRLQHFSEYRSWKRFVIPAYPCPWLASDSQSLILLTCYHAPDGIPAGPHILLLRLVIRRHSIITETKRSALCRVPQLASWTLQSSMAITFSWSSPIEHVAVHRWTLKWSCLVNRDSFRACSALSWWPPR